MSTTAPSTLSTKPPSDAGLDYAALRTEGIRLVQRLSGDIWTDYNFSDPGVTALEQLCLALTELSYRALYPTADLLADPRTGRVKLWRQGLYPVTAILPTDPVTGNDLRRMLLDRVPEIFNVWCDPLPADQSGGVAGLYRFRVYTAGSGSTECTDRRRVGRAVERLLACYNGHRSLCEDVGTVTVLTLVRTWAGARVLIESSADPDQVMAEVLFALALHLAPEPRRTPLATQTAAGKSTAEIFDGPLMLRGFIGDTQLRPYPATIAVSDLVDITAALPGVLLVEDLTLRVDGQDTTYTSGDTIAVPPDSLLSLDTQAAVTGGTMVLYKGTARCTIDDGRVMRLLRRMWRTHRKTYDLPAEYRSHYKPPEGRRVDLASYTSVQNQFPDVYGINAAGVPAGSSVPRKAQARQFKGYLMPFDQLMADYFSQLSFLRDLYSPRTGGATTYVWQSLAGIVPDGAALMAPTYDQGMTAIVRSTDPVRTRKSRVLSLLLSLYAQRLEPPHTMRARAGVQPPPVLVRAQRELLVRMVPATRDRGRGFDYRRPLRFGGSAGMEIRCRIELDLVDAAHGPAAQTYGQAHGTGAVPVDSQADATWGQPLDDALQNTVREQFMGVERMLDDLPPPGTTASPPLEGHRVAAPLLSALGDPARYRMGFHAQRDVVVVVCFGTDGRWWVIGEYRGPVPALEAIRRLLHSHHHRTGPHRRHLTIVERTLLRSAAAITGGGGSGYGFRIDAVVGASHREAADPVWRTQAEAVIRRNTPAHIAVDCLFLDGGRMHRFRHLHADWVWALADGDPERRALASARLEHFLDACRTGTPDEPAPESPTPGSR